MFRTLTAVLAVSALVFTGCGDDDREGDVAAEPEAEVSATPTSGSAPLTVQFSSEGSGVFGDSELEFSWDFGDGATSEEPNPSHTYTEGGDYEAVLEVTTLRGANDLASIEITVSTATPSTVADPSFEEWAGDVNEACMESSEAAMEAEAAAGGNRNSPEALAAFVEITNAESAAVGAAGVPTERTDEAETWIAKRTEVATMFVELATAGGVDAADPRVAAFDAAGMELETMSSDLGLMYCTSGSQ